ncbi:hypothetical protein Ae717Ps2_5922c [Pseudonocardia sp. Ae717_Ps2]|uniref:hypothetical protein n=1 Tax=Pseudonocardia sp. Ae717_Ps2 TaxID=1885573 RepID=UPI00094AF565|nr:hypothetical protein [Pseudonocardia sp. Ae717_Ps2]OLM28953.1 hypothetical protein Ae717Ps2_5877c [Pseudonocardia sp. Ae717_Ps2]OLM28998.1 hypothetical protein Ae717Ps2_5922c [Pseudonocardia sp. Ae717_Ps2]
MARSSVVTRRTRFEHAARLAAERAAAREKDRGDVAGETASSGAHAAAFWSRLKAAVVPTGDRGAPLEVGGDDRCENARRVLVADRNSRRRWPWIPAAAGGGVGMGGHWIGAAAAALGATTDPGVFAGPAAALPVAAAVLGAARYRSHVGRWWPELCVSGAGASVLAHALATTGPSPLLGAAAVLGTTVLGTRWWRAHPLGPQVVPLTSSELPALAPPDPEHDRYCLAWAQTNGSKTGKVPGSRLTNRVDGPYTTTFDVVLARGVHTVADLLTHRVRLAGGLGEPADRVLFAPAAAGESAARARLTVIHTDPVADTRYFTVPRVHDGLIQGVGRSVDGTGEVDVVMWNDSGTVPTMIVGSTGGGKSGATNILTTAALSTGVLNLLYADPKGNSSTALATRARVAVIGKHNVLALPRLIGVILAARARIAAQLGSDLIFPSVEMPGWMFLHDEYSFVAHDPTTAALWTETVNTVRALGVWVVGCNQSQGQAAWGGDHARSAFASQVIAFRTNSKSSSDLVPGLVFDPNELPLDDARPRRPVPGMAVHAHLDAPVRWDWLPSDADAARMTATGRPAPELTVSTAFDRHFTQPDLHPLDTAAITTVLGPAINGRWQIGGLGGTHHLTDGGAAGAGAGAGSGRGGLRRSPQPSWGTRTATADTPPAPAPAGAGGVSPVQAEVLALIEGGTTATAELVAAAAASKAAVHDALDTLIGQGRIARVARGRYQATTVAATAAPAEASPT